MVNRFSFTRFLLLSPAVYLLTSSSGLMEVAPPGGRGTAGVFMVIEGGRYTFNYSVARETCQRLNVTMATREQMERALQEGLETCKFGWIAEQIAVIPRLTSDGKCGRGQTGLAVWRAHLDTKFAVFCYNASDLNVTTNSPVTSPSSTSSTAPIPRTQTPPAVTPSVTSKHTPTPNTEPTTSAQKKLRTLTPTSPAKTTRPTTMPPTAPPTGHRVTWTGVPSSGLLSPSEPALTRSVVVSTENSVSAGATALIILGVVVLLLTASGAVWYHKLSVDQCGARGLQKDDTEMWKHADSEMDLRNREGPEDEEEEESQRKYSSEITLVMNPAIKENVSD